MAPGGDLGGGQVARGRLRSGGAGHHGLGLVEQRSEDDAVDAVDQAIHGLTVAPARSVIGSPEGSVSQASAAVNDPSAIVQGSISTPSQTHSLGRRCSGTSLKEAAC